MTTPVDPTTSRRGATPRGASATRWVVRFVLTTLGGAYIGVGAFFAGRIIESWRPCFEATDFNSSVCMTLQTDFWFPVGAFEVWIGGLALCLALAIVSAFVARSHTVALLIAGAVVLTGWVIVDYIFTPTFNGGYGSHDSPPGFGTWMCLSLCCAGAIMLFSAARRAR